MEEIIQQLLVPILTTIAGAFSGWFFGRKKQQAEVVMNELEAVEKAVSIWRQIAQDLQKEMALQSEQINQMRTEIDALRSDNKRLYLELKRIKAETSNNVA